MVTWRGGKPDNEPSVIGIRPQVVQTHVPAHELAVETAEPQDPVEIQHSHEPVAEPVPESVAEPSEAKPEPEIQPPVESQPEIKDEVTKMSFKSVLSTIGADVKGVFAWLGSAKGQAVIAAGEGAVETIAPQLTGLINLANGGLTEIIKVEALAAGAAEQTGSGAQKLIMASAAVTPAILAYAEENGLPVPTATTIQNAVNGLVAFANALEGK